MASSKIALPPSQGHNIKLSIINGARSHLPASYLVVPTIKGQDYMRLACYSFLIESSHRDQKVLFDLAFMKDLDDRMPPPLKAIFAGGDGGIDSVYNIPDVLTANSLNLSAINAIIWSHSHIDHVGDPSVFPPSTDLIVGPTFRSNHMPGYPANPSAFLLDSAFQGRNVHEIDFSQSEVSIGGFRAIDFFGDGSFYLLEGTGHTRNHLCALARTTNDSFVLLAGDACHNVGQLRPSEYRPLPESVSPSVLEDAGPKSTVTTSYSCARFKPLLPSGESSSFYGLSPGMHDDIVQAEETVRKLKEFDGRDDVLVVLTHDFTLLDVVDFYPKTMNEWKARGWGELGRWRFLEDFKDLVAAS